MTEISQSGFMQSLGWAILNSLWQMALLWILFQGTIFLFKIKKSSYKTALAVTFLLSGFAWFLVTFISSHILTTESQISLFIIPASNYNENVYSGLNTFLPFASVAYLFLLLFPLIQFLRNYRFVRVIRAQGLKKIEKNWRTFIKKTADAMGINKPVHIWLSEKISSPVTIGYLKPIILVPLAAINHLSPQQLEAVLLHELAHIRRYDYLVNLIINFIRTILYFNPFVKAFVKTIEREREKSCDEMVVQFQYDPHSYASALLILEKGDYLSRPFALAASGKKSDLIQRIEIILGIQKRNSFSFNRIAGLLAGLLCIISLNALLIFSKPSKNNGNQLGNSLVFTDLSSPFLFPAGKETRKAEILNSEITSPQIKSVDQPKEQKIIRRHPVSKSAVVSQVSESDDKNQMASSFMNVNYKPETEIPQLKSYQVAQINDALSKSKEIFKESQWKAIEKDIADAMTSDEKNKFRQIYSDKISKMDLSDWKDKLSLAYDRIDWNQINEQLGDALFDIKLDSIQKSFSDAIMNLENLECQLIAFHTTGIPDSDITLQKIAEEKTGIQKALNQIKVLRSKKVIRL